MLYIAAATHNFTKPNQKFEFQDLYTPLIYLIPLRPPSSGLSPWKKNLSNFFESAFFDLAGRIVFFLVVQRGGFNTSSLDLEFGVSTQPPRPARRWITWQWWTIRMFVFLFLFDSQNVCVLCDLNCFLFSFTCLLCHYGTGILGS